MTLALLALRAAVILAFALVAMRLLARASATTRRSVLVAAFVIVLGLPIVTAVLPALHLRGDATADRAALAAASAPDPVLRGAPAVVVPVALPVVQHAPAIAEARATSHGPPIVVVFGVWALGVLAVLGRLGVGLVRARRLVASARFIETLDLEGRPVEIRISSAIETPAVTGLFVPVVLLPSDAETWSAERRRIVLAHEIAHVTSRDCLASAIAQLAVALHWFDPLVWIAARRLREERELAADEKVLGQGVLASSYAEHLLALATRSERPVPAGALAMAESSQLPARIRALLVPRPRHSFGHTRFALIGAGLGITALVACATPERDTPEVAHVTATSTPPAPVAPGTRASTVDPAIQAIAEVELERMIEASAPCFGIVLVLDPGTGHVLAVAYRGGNEPDAEHAARRPMVAGSTAKPLLVAVALEERVISPTDRFDATPEPLGRIRDAEPHGMLDVGAILAVSSNVGLVKIFDRLGSDKLAAWHARFRLASAPVAPDAEVAIGVRLMSTPLEMAAAYATLANGGIYRAPTFVDTPTTTGERVVRTETANAVLGLLEGVTGDRGTGRAARVAGTRVAGKTATAHLGKATDTKDYYSSFVGTAPLERPRYVIFVGAETPRDGGTGGQVAAPVFGRLMTRLLER